MPMPALPKDFVLYNDLVTNHIIRPTGCDVTKIPAPVATKNVSGAFVYDEYTKTMWVVGAAGKLINAYGRLLTLDGYRAYWAQSVYSKDHC
jgi:hypothetical protein